MKRRRDRGAVLALVAIGLAAFVAFLVIAVDVGRLAHTANEVQSAADGAAAAGGTALLTGGGAAGAATQARAIANGNIVDGQPAGAMIQDVAAGIYDQTTGTFTVTASSPSAVRVRAQTTVGNIIAGALGSKTTTVARSSVGTFTGIRTATPTLPFVIGDCAFQAISSCFGTDTCMPKPTRAPSAATRTAWVMFGSSTASIAQYLPRACKGTLTPPQLTVGSTLRINQAVQTTVLNNLRACITPGRSEYLVPVANCTASNVSTRVTGFATIVIDSVTTSGANRGVAAHGAFRQVAGVPNGCAKCGTGFVQLVN